VHTCVSRVSPFLLLACRAPRRLIPPAQITRRSTNRSIDRSIDRSACRCAIQSVPTGGQWSLACWLPRAVVLFFSLKIVLLASIGRSEEGETRDGADSSKQECMDRIGWGPPHPTARPPQGHVSKGAADVGKELWLGPDQAGLYRFVRPRAKQTHGPSASPQKQHSRNRAAMMMMMMMMPPGPDCLPAQALCFDFDDARVCCVYFDRLGTVGTFITD
jgi:hypothetical protein